MDQTREHTDATERCLSKLANTIRWERVEFASLTRARNYGVKLARGEIILFVDDDVEPSPHLIDRHIACYQNPEVWAVAGCALLPGKRQLSRNDLTVFELRAVEAGRSNRFDLDWPHVTTWASGCNMSFRRDKVLAIGGFDEAFYGSAVGEEVELCFRIRKAGGVIQYAPDAELVHLIVPSGGCRDARAEEELVAQLLDNAYYMLRRIDKPWAESWTLLLRQCRTIAFNWGSLREWTWPKRLIWCLKGLQRACQGAGRKPILPFFQNAPVNL